MVTKTQKYFEINVLKFFSKATICHFSNIMSNFMEIKSEKN